MLAASVLAAPSSCQVVSGLAGYEVPARAIGDACEVDPECTSGHCADGICCESACDGACVTCNAADSIGTCVNHPALSDPDGDCGMLGHCDGQGTCAIGTHLWSKAFGDQHVLLVKDLALDSADDIVLAGSFSGAIDFGGEVLHSVGHSDVTGDDAYVAKLGANGEHRWSRSFGDAEPQAATSVATDENNNVFVTGEFDGAVDFGLGNELSAGAHGSVFLLALDTQGSTRWARAFGVSFPGHEQDSRLGPPTLAVDGQDNVLLYGHFRGEVDFGDGPLASIGDEDVYVVKFSSGGQLLWQRSFGLTPSGQVIPPPWSLRIEVDSTGDLILCGTYQYGIDFGAGIHLADAEQLDQAFVAKLSGADGTPRWSRGLDGPGAQSVGAIAIDGADDSVVVAGAFTGQLGVDGASLPASGPANADLFVTRFAADSTHVRTRRYPAGPGIVGQMWNAPNEIAIDSNGTVAIYGMLSNSISFGANPVLSAGLLDVFIAKLTPGLEHVLSKRYGDGAVQMAWSGAVDHQGNMVVTGHFEQKLDFGGPEALYNEADEDVFLVKFSP